MSTPKVGAPVVGFNHNVKHRDQVFHVQTEDSGLPHAHYITHLFVGGNIVNSMKTSYSEHVGSPEMAGLVRKLMETQHKQMLKRLVSGEFNAMIAKFTASAAHYEPGVLASGQLIQSTVNQGATAPMTAGGSLGSAPVPHAPAAKAPPLPPIKPPPAPGTKVPPVMAPVAKPAPAAPIAQPARPVPPRAPTSPQQPVWQPAPPGSSTPAVPPRQPGAPLPTTVRAPASAPRPAIPPPRAAPTPIPTPGHSPMMPPAASRPAPRPVAAAAPVPNIFADDSRPVEAPHDDLPTLFAEELISEKSLDEVILAFLSADLEPPK